MGQQATYSALKEMVVNSPVAFLPSEASCIVCVFSCCLLVKLIIQSVFLYFLCL